MDVASNLCRSLDLILDMHMADGELGRQRRQSGKCGNYSMGLLSGLFHPPSSTLLLTSLDQDIPWGQVNVREKLLHLSPSS